jgi:hypothetical protein
MTSTSAVPPERGIAALRQFERVEKNNLISPVAFSEPEMNPLVFFSVYI